MQITLLLPDGKTPEQPLALSDLPALLTGEPNLVWVDITGPGDEDIAVMRDIFHFHPLAIEDTRNHRQRPKVEEYADYAFIILNTVTLDNRNLVFRELDVFVGKNYFVTVHGASEPCLDEFRERLERKHPHLALNPSYLLYVLIDRVVDSFFPVLDTMEEEIEMLGDDILANPRQEYLNRLFQLKSALIDLWRVVWPQRELLNNLAHHAAPVLDLDPLQHYLRDVSDHLMWIADMVTTFRDTLTGVIDLYLSSVSNRLNRVVNRLTVFTLIIGALTVIGGFYGMNFAKTWPPFSAEYGVLFVLFLMLTVPTVLLVVFRKLGWY